MSSAHTTWESDIDLGYIIVKTPEAYVINET